MCKTWGNLKEVYNDPVGYVKDIGESFFNLAYVIAELEAATELSYEDQTAIYDKYGQAMSAVYDHVSQMSAAEWQTALEDVAARGLSDAITFKALSTGIKTVGKVRTMLKERNLAKKSLQLTKLVREEGSAVRAAAIIEQESRAEKMRNLFSRAIERLENPHTEVVTPEGMVVKVPKEGNLHFMESGSKSGSTNKTGRKSILKVGKIEEFFETEFGKLLKENSIKTNKTYDKKTIYEVTNKLKKYGLREGDLFYLDAMHKDHIEVFTKHGKPRTVLSLDGRYLVKKFEKAEKQGRFLKT